MLKLRKSKQTPLFNMITRYPVQEDTILV